MYETTSRDRPRIDSPEWARLTAVAVGLWRVADQSGRIVGHIRAVTAHGDCRYRAERFHRGSRSFRALGEFWRVGEAFDCLRYIG